MKKKKEKKQQKRTIQSKLIRDALPDFLFELLQFHWQTLNLGAVEHRVLLDGLYNVQRDLIGIWWHSHLATLQPAKRDILLQYSNLRLTIVFVFPPELLAIFDDGGDNEDDVIAISRVKIRRNVSSRGSMCVRHYSVCVARYGSLRDDRHK